MNVEPWARVTVNVVPGSDEVAVTLPPMNVTPLMAVLPEVVKVNVVLAVVMKPTLHFTSALVFTLMPLARAWLTLAAQ